MIPNQTEVANVESTLEATGQFTVDQNSLGKIMSVLTNLYTDPEMAVAREYITNALDSQIEAQEADPNYVWRPVEITTPSSFNKEYKVRDFGTGMNVDDIKEIYSKYGKSTKESSQSVTGMLGLGSKCALTYTGQFTITGYKNGVRCRAVVSKDENNIPVFMIVDTAKTNEPNGVEISVPVRDRNSFEQKTRELLRWWKPGQALLNGAEVTPHGYLKIQDSPVSFKDGSGKTVTAPAEVYLIENSGGYGGSPQSYVIMGNVPYKVDANYVNADLRNVNFGFAAYVPMGAIDFPPSREELTYTKRTIDMLSQISEGLFETIIEEKLKSVTAQPTHREAWLAWNSLSYHFANTAKAQSLTYKGDKFQKTVDHDHKFLDWDWNGHGQIAERSRIQLGNHMATDDFGVIVVGCDLNAKPTSYFKKKVRHYLRTNNISGDKALLVDKDVDSIWLKHLKRVTADHIKSIKLPKDPSQSGPRAEAEYEYYTLDKSGNHQYNSATTVPYNGTTLVYVSPQDMRETYRKRGTSAQSVLAYLGSKYTLVVLGKNRFDKFLRTHKNAIPLKDAWKKVIKEKADAALDIEFVLGDLNHAEQEFLRLVDHSTVDDPAVVEAAKAVQSKNFTKNYADAQNMAIYGRRAEVYCDVPERTGKTKPVNPLKPYPLVCHAGGTRNNKHLVIYMNAVYQQTQAQSKP